MANPPFNISDWWNEKLDGDARWQFGTPPRGNAKHGYPPDLEKRAVELVLRQAETLSEAWVSSP
jgi:type I restriction-modification system DNA methylase subunit